MKEITGFYISVMIVLAIWFVLNAIRTHKRFYNLYDNGWGYGNRPFWDILTYNFENSNGGQNHPTLWIIIASGIYTFCWIVYFVFEFIIY